MSILKIKNEKGEWQGVTSVKGEKGEPGISPDITVAKNDKNTYKLRINTKERQFTTPNLKGDAAASIGNTDGELGRIDNWYEWEGHRVTPANGDLPALPRLETHNTRYCFDHDVVMYTMDGLPNDKGICSFEDYTRHEGSVITVPPNGQETLTDYVIYNARPKYEWDTWDDKQLMKKERRLGFPNMAARTPNGDCPFTPGDWNWIDVKMYDAADIPAVADTGLLYFGKAPGIGEDNEEGVVGDAPEIPDGQLMELDRETPPLLGLISVAPRMKTGIWMTFDQDAEGNCCGEDYQWGISRILERIHEHDQAVQDHPREMGCVLVCDGDLQKATDCEDYNVFKEAQGCRGIAVALNPNTNYTIESLNGPVAILASSTSITSYHGESMCYHPYVTKVKTDLFETRVETVTVSKGNEATIVGANTIEPTGKVATSQDKIFGTRLMYYTNDKPAYVGRAEVPAVCRTPHKVIDKDESFTFRTGTTYNGGFMGNPHYGVYLFCWNEEDYAGIKITEGIEKYSDVNAERIAAGATKMKMSVKFGNPNDETILGNDDINYYEYNIRLSDTTDDNGYVRYLTNECKKSYDLDEFSLVGHHHTVDEIDNIADLKIPTMEISVETLVDGVSPLEENHYYFVVEGE